MKKRFTLLIFFVLFASYLQAQVEVEISNHVENQVIQGPCYLFATMAALESKAIEEGVVNNTINLSEWSLYNSCVLQSDFIPGGKFMIERSLTQAKDNGIVEQDFNYTVTSPAMAFNMNTVDVGYLRIPSACSSGDCGKDVYEVGEGCAPIKRYEPNGFEFSVASAAPAIYLHPNADGKIFEKDLREDTDLENKFKQRIDNGTGVIFRFSSGFLDSRNVDHAVYIYGYRVVNGVTTWLYKDSWPGETTRLRESEIDLTDWANFYHPYYVVGIPSTSSTPPAGSNGNGSTPTCHKPSNILVQSLEWDPINNTACPNTTMILDAVDNNPAYPATTYQWNVSGATIISGQGTSTLTVQTGSFGSLNFSVKAICGPSSESGWHSLPGSIDSFGCGGGGGGFMFNKAEEVSMDYLKSEDVKAFVIYDFNGKLIQKGSNVAPVENQLPKGDYIIRYATTQGMFTRKIRKLE